MLEAIKEVLRIVSEEAQRRRWLNALRLTVAALTYTGASVLTIHLLLKWIFPAPMLVAAWVVVVSLALVIVLLVAINFMRTFHRRAVEETRSEWDRREPLLEKLYALNIKGRQLRQMCDDKSRVGEPLSDEDLRQIRIWHQGAAYDLEHRLGIEYRRRFYEHSPSGETVPTSATDCSVWVHTRRQKIKEVIAELRQPPPRLISEAEVKQLEAGIRIIGRDQFDD